MGSTTEAAWYVDPSTELSQGDIVELVPSGLIDAPLTVCQPHNSSESGKAFYAPLDQIRRKPREFLHANFSVGLGIVTWPDCQIDKLKNQKRPEREWFASIAPIYPLTTLAPELHPKVMNFERAQWFPLPPLAARIPEPGGYVDLRYVWPLRYALLQRRVAALNEDAKMALALHTFWFQTDLRLVSDPRCPHCAKPIAVDNLFEDDDAG